MKDLLPLEAYERTNGAVWWRGALAMAVFWAVPTAYIDILGSRNLLEIGPTMVLAVLAGLGFGTLYMGMTEHSARRLARRVYRLDPAIVPEPPEGHQEYRLACSYLPDGEMAVGGHLYVGPGALTFVPHRKNSRRLRTPLTLPAGAGIAVEIVEVRLGGLERLFAESPSRRLRIRAGDECADFLAPDPDEVAEALRGYYGSTAALHPPNAPEIARLRSAGREPPG
jgi:hypothetical protein